MRFKSVITIALVACAPALLVVGYYFWRNPPFRGSNEQLVANNELESQADEARMAFPFQSLESRLPKGRGIALPKTISLPVAQRLDAMERAVEDKSSFRSNLLKELHEKTRDLFVKSPGFGSDREIPYGYILPESPPVSMPQPGYPAAFPISSGDVMGREDPNADHYAIHASAALNFLNPRSFGYFKDRQHVAGFQSHGFRSVPVPSQKPWKVENILLVGILSNEQPMVYLSDHLPSMEQLRRGQTRWLDAFEESGLTALKGGEDLQIIRKDDTLRMLGALRATSQCLKCHEAQKGDLLGAFSYTLRQVKVGDMP